MSVEGVSSLLMKSSPGRSHTIPLEHLDYSYIQHCQDLKYLEKILNVLRSGTEGTYPQLTDFCEKRIETLEPRHRALRKDTFPATAASFSTDEWKHITDDLQTWQREITEREQQLMQSPTFNLDTLPPVRNFTLQRPPNTTATASSKRCAVPRAYSDWDRFDVDKECAKIDEDINSNDAPAVIKSAHTNITHHIDTSVLTQQEKCVLATREKEKGNEAFRARDWDEAVVYYTRSLDILPTVAGFNNRAQAEIKLQRWTDALKDCDAVLNIERHNYKALLRRATVSKHLGKLQEAHDDITSVLHSEPHNVTAQKLLQEVNEKINTELPHKSCPPKQPRNGKKLLIEEVDEEKDEETNGETDAESERVDKYPETEEQMDGETARQAEIKVDGEIERQTERWTDGVKQCVDTAAVKLEGNDLYRKGQYGEAAEKYTHSITTLTRLGVYSKDDMFVLYCNRAACFLKMGQCSECVSDCCRALHLKPYSVKALLRRAMAFEALEMFRLAYVDYRTVQQINNSHIVQQHVNRLTKVLMELDGPDWRTKLPELPFVPMSIRHDCTETLPTSQTTPITHPVPTMKTPPNTGTPPTMKISPTRQCAPTVEVLVHTETPPTGGPSQTRRCINIAEVERDVTDEDGDEGIDDKDEDGAAAAADEIDVNYVKTSGLANRCAVPPANNDWDRFDVDKECAKIDEDINTNDAPAVIKSAHTNITHHIDTSALTQQEKCVLATREKEKGNEAFRARDWDEAVVYYTRSLDILPTVAGFNNRAHAEIKLQRWTDALKDCDAVLNIERHNYKALLRRATAYKHLGKLQEAHDDITSVLHSEPHNVTAQKLLQEVNEKINTELPHKSCPPKQPRNGKKLLIEEVGEEKDEETNGETDAESERVDKYPETEEQMDGETTRQAEVKVDGEIERQTERWTDGVKQCVDTAAVKLEGNDLYRKGQYGEAAEKYTHSITTLTRLGVYSKDDMFVLYCNRAACFLKMGQCSECVSDCCRALHLKPYSVKAFLRRAMAFEALENFRLAYVDYRTVQQINNSHIVQQHVNRLTKVLMELDGPDWRTKLPELPFVPMSIQHDCTETLPTSQTTPITHPVPTMKTPPNTGTPPTMKISPTRQCPPTVEVLVHTETPPTGGPSQIRRCIKIAEVESDVTDEDEDGDKGIADKDKGGAAAATDEIDVNYIKTSCLASVLEFRQALKVARCRGDLVACAQLLRSVSPQTLPQYISLHLDTDTLSFIIHTLHKHILTTEPGLVYRLLTHLHTIDRFTVVLMLMDSDEKRQITQLFECLRAVESDELTHENINSLAKKFI
ncbi:sperm-associated antigen 1 isoform X1 [Tachysurus vachellii]|uniref:sperm-associated antigen 1 isoform X1 n=1 Tax=Tachysurus vachellii TaxID=175792 RepID=UPI00296B26B0|nr:sperm-associated antigen 1 isoform X1 [Tachysurus vachellii]XP_060726929.1 sperm-associated antigen 1 isoform X1 [Tachysurus vachellii]XP_060726930.1 sperm-associated antigen 1 isoform X1 [Tachysurus vachellii]